jgi:hypothetical protein
MLGRDLPTTGAAALVLILSCFDRLGKVQGITKVQSEQAKETEKIRR